MKTKQTDQMRWVVALLATAVILPTVCLLWFMTQAVRNERLAVRQKLLDIGQEGAEGIKKNLLQTTAAHTGDFRRSVNDGNIHAMRIVGTQVIRQDADSVVIYDKDDTSVFPVPETATNVSFYEPLASAFAFEQADNFTEALAVYQQLAERDLPAEALFAAYTGQLRCLEKLGQIHAMSPLFNTVLHTHRKRWTAEQIAMLRVMEYDVLATHWNIYPGKGLLDDLEAWYRLSESYPSATTIWALGKILTAAETISHYDDLHKSLDEPMAWLRETIRIESLALTAADFFDAQPAFRDRPAGMWYAVPTEPMLFVLPVETDNHRAYYLMTQESWLDCFEPVLADSPIPGTQAVVFDDLGRIVFGTPPAQVDPFLTTALDGFMAGWSLAFYFDSDDPFSVAAERQAAIYMWTGMLVVALILLAGIVAIRAIGQQIRLNALKNNFIATVTHELKTPLSSMRLLVETLLDGGYTDRPRCREYLDMIDRENCRLSRMIDSFLTFSRMERGKQVFDMQPVDPAEIARDAAEAMQAKFQEKKCRFSVTADTGLSSIIADKDAVVTVLVNLLDNACKYSGDDKEIRLRVFEQDGGVCFSIADNGIGMTRRQLRRIFDKFYQADTSLARRAEGCGLGLSIVKYILDAHKATITVDSKPDKGSVFTVLVPRDEKVGMARPMRKNGNDFNH